MAARFRLHLPVRWDGRPVVTGRFSLDRIEQLCDVLLSRLVHLNYGSLRTDGKDETPRSVFRRLDHTRTHSYCVAYNIHIR